MAMHEGWIRAAGRSDEDDERRTERDWILSAIAGAIVDGRLPPDDACAWARIAAIEARRLWSSSTEVSRAA